MTGSNDHDERRRFYRNHSPRVILIIGDIPFLAKNWSPDGFCIYCPDSHFSENDIISGEIDIFDAPDKGTFKAEIVRIDENGDIAAKFIDISSHSYMTLCMTVATPDPESE